MAVETEAATAPDLAALADTDINWDRLDKTRFHIIGAILFTAQSALLHPTAVVKTRMQVAGSGLSHMRGISVFRQILKSDGIPGIFRGFGTSAVGSLPGRVLALTSLEVSKDMMLKYTEHLNMSEATRVGIANGVAGMLSNLVSCIYYVPLEVTCQRLMVQGLPGTTFCNGPFDVVRKVIKAEGFRGMYRGFGLTAVTQSPASALWWGAYGAAQHIIWRSLGYKDNMVEKPSHMEMVTVQATAGMLAGACSSVITTPLDTVKTRLQVMDDYGVGRPSVIKTAKTLLKEDGWWGFYRGFGPRFLNMSLYGTTMIVTYELIRFSFLASPSASLRPAAESRSDPEMAPKKGVKPVAAAKKKPEKVVNPLFEKRPKQFGIGGALPPKKDLHRFVKWPKVVQIQRKRRILCQRLKVPPSLNQFTKTLDKNLATNLFKMLLKYRPEDKAAKKERLLKAAQAQAEGKPLESKKPIVVKYGLNHVTYLVEQNKAQLVIIAHDVDPIELVVWLPALCRKMEIPYCIVKGKARLGTIVHKKTSSVLCLTTVKNEDKMEFSKILEAIKANFNDKYDENRKKWGGGIMGSKSQAKTKAKERLLAKEAAQRIS
ncbi:hypothetical protein U1Q18_041396 [Sarracenia purpurea var. burkii]